MTLHNRPEIPHTDLTTARFRTVFEIFDGTSVDAKAAYGDLYPAAEGETLYTSFVASPGPFGPSWTLEMGVVGDSSRTSKVVVDQPYMGLGAKWPVPSVSWSELNFTNICINSCVRMRMLETIALNSRDALLTTANTPPLYACPSSSGRSTAVSTLTTSLRAARCTR